VPVIYSIFVLDLKLIKWDTSEHKEIAPEAAMPPTADGEATA